jgi:hypothetical protein
MTISYLVLLDMRFSCENKYCYLQGHDAVQSGRSSSTFIGLEISQGSNQKYPEDGSTMFFRNVTGYLPGYAVPHLSSTIIRRQGSELLRASLNKEVKLSLYVEAPTFSRQSAHRWRWNCQPYAPASRPLLPGRFLELICVRGWIDSRAVMRLEGLGQLENPMTSSGIEPSTVRLRRH